MNSLKQHPHKYVLDALKLEIDHMPVKVPKELSEKAHAAYDAFVNDPSVSAETIEEKVIEIGRSSWPYRKAFEEMYTKYGKKREEELFMEELPPDVREKFAAWKQSGKSLASPNDERDLETSFTADEKFALEEAMLSAEESVRGEVDELIEGEKAAEYEEHLKRYEETQRTIIEKLGELRTMGTNSHEWSGDIFARIKTFEEGWGMMGQEPTLEAIEREIESWRGNLEVELVSGEGPV